MAVLDTLLQKTLSNISNVASTIFSATPPGMMYNSFKKLPDQIQQINSVVPGGISGGIQRITSQPLSTYTPLSMKSAAVPYAQTALKPFVGQQRAQDIGYALRGALNLTPFQTGFAGAGKPDLYEPITPRQQTAQRIGQAGYGTALTAPLGGASMVKNIASRVIQGGLLGTGMQAAGNLISGRPIGTDLKQGALTGVENSWQLAITNSITDKFAAKFLPKLTSNSVNQSFKILGGASVMGLSNAAKMAALKLGATRLFQRALLEVPAENTLFTLTEGMNQQQKETYIQRWINNLPGNVLGNLLYAGVAIGGGGAYNFNKSQIDQALDAFGKTLRNRTKSNTFNQSGMADFKLLYPELFPKQESSVPIPGTGKLTNQAIMEGLNEKPSLKRAGIELTRTDLKTLLNNMPEFRKSPIMTINAEGNLEFNGSKSRFTINPEALGLNKESFNLGDTLNVKDIPTQKGKIPIVLERGVKKPTPDPNIVLKLQESISEGEALISSGRDSIGRKMTPERIEGIRRATENSRKRLAEITNTEQLPQTPLSPTVQKPGGGVADVKVVADNIARNNPEISKMDSEAMARDVIKNRAPSENISVTRIGSLDRTRFAGYNVGLSGSQYEGGKPYTLKNAKVVDLSTDEGAGELLNLIIKNRKQIEQGISSDTKLMDNIRKNPSIIIDDAIRELKNGGGLDYGTVEQYGIDYVAKHSGIDGIKYLENQDLPGQPTSALIFNKEKLVPVSDTGKLPQQVQKLTPFDTPEIIAERQRIKELPQTYLDNTPERKALRDQVITDLSNLGSFSGKDQKGEAVFSGPIKQEKRVDIVIGNPASGKSSIMSNPLSQEHGSRIIDSDMAKARLGKVNDAPALHVESSDIAEGKLLEMAVRNGDNIVLPLVGKNAQKMHSLVDLMVEKGYEVHVHLVDLSKEKATQRAIKRFNETGRFVDPDYVFNQVGDNPSKTYDIIKGSSNITSYEKLSSDVPFGEKPTVIEQSEYYRSGRGISGQSNQNAPGNAKPAEAATAAETIIPPEQKERKFVQTVREAKTTAPEVADQITGYYDIIPNKQALAEANKVIATVPHEEAIRLATEGEQSAVNTAIGMDLMRRAQNAGNFEEATQIAEKMASKATKAGQATQAFSIWSRLTPEGMLKYAEKTLRESNQKQSALDKTVNALLKRKEVKLTPEDSQILTELMKKANAATTEKEKAAQLREVFTYIGKKLPWGVSDMIDEYRYNNMLSNPLTHLRNIYSNVLQTYISRPGTLAMQGKPMEAVKYELAALKALPDAFKNAAKAFKGGADLKRMDVSEVGKMQPIKPKHLGKVANIPSTALEAMDQFFSTIIKEGELARGATTADAQKMADYSLFRQDIKPEGQGFVLNSLDEATKAIYQLRKVGLGWFIPFVRTPMNVAKQWIEYSPAGVATLPGAANKKEQLAKALMGTVATAFGAKLAMEGRTTWAAPTDETQKKLFYDSGRKPFSVKIGDRWIPMQYFGIYAWAMGIPAANKYFQEESRTALTDDQLDKMMKVATSLAGFWSNQTFVSGLGQFVQMAEGNTDRTFSRNIGFTLSQLKPMSGLMNYVANVIDPIYRKPSGIVQNLKAGVPFMTKDLPYYETSIGTPAKRNETNYIPYPYGQGKADPEYDELYKLRTEQGQQRAVLNKYETDMENQAKAELTGVQAAGGETPKEQILTDMKDQMALDMAKTKVRIKGGMEQVGSVVVYKTDKGTVTTVDTNWTPDPPALTGQYELDKKLRSEFISSITSRQTDIKELYQLGKLTAPEAESAIRELNGLKFRSSGGGVRKLKVKKPSVKKLSIKKIKMPKLKALKMKKPKKLKLTALKKPNISVLKVKS